MSAVAVEPTVNLVNQMLNVLLKIKKCTFVEPTRLMVKLRVYKVVKSDIDRTLMLIKETNGNFEKIKNVI